MLIAISKNFYFMGNPEEKFMSVCRNEKNGKFIILWCVSTKVYKTKEFNNKEEALCYAKEFEKGTWFPTPSVTL